MRLLTFCSLSLTAASLIFACSQNVRGKSDSDGGSGGAQGDGDDDSGGGAGDGDGLGGGGGEAPIAQACEVDEDCNDELHCNGAEWCDEGMCTPGEDPCASLEESGCVVTCTEGTDSAECEVAVIDDDGDGHAATGNTCSASPELPRDDCDDDEGAAYPDNSETCDGIDNNCNGIDDLGEGLGLGGSVLTIASGSEAGGIPHVTWSEALQIWVVIATFDSTETLRVWRFQPNGTEIGEYVDIALTSGVRAVRLDSAWRDDVLLLSFGGSGGSSAGYELARFEFSGAEHTPSLVEQPKRLSSSSSQAVVSVAAVPQGWGAFYALTSSEGHVLRMGSSGQTIPPTLSVEPVGYKFGLGAAGDRLTGVWWEPDPETVGDSENFAGFRLVMSQWGGSDLAPVIEKKILIPNSKAELAYGGASVSEVGDDAFIFARKASNSQTVLRVDNQGEVVCGPLELPGYSTPFGNTDVLYMSTNESYGVFLTNEFDIYRVPTDCVVPTGGDVVQSAPLDGQPVGYVNQSLASGSRGHAIVWHGTHSGAFALHMRLWGNALCDDIE